MRAAVAGWHERGHDRGFCVFLAILVGFVPLLLCGLGLWLPRLWNDRQLAAFADNLYEHPLPPQTTVVARDAQLLHPANGNGCFFIVSQSMLTSLSVEEIEVYYENVWLPRLWEPPWAERYDIPGEVLPHVDVDEAHEPGQNRVILTILDVGSELALDLRCH